MEIQSVVDTIRKLANMTVAKGCTEAEAINAASKIGKLLKVYNLTIDKVFLDNNRCVTLRIPIQGKNRRPVDVALTAIASFCDCKVWFSKGYTRNSEYCIFGMETDTEMAKYLYDTICEAIESETTTYQLSGSYRTSPVKRLLTISFQKGMASRISRRLRDMAAERRREQEVEERPVVESTGTSLILLKTNKVETEFEALGMGLRAHRGAAARVHFSAYSAGKQAGDRVNLNRPIRGNVAGLLQ